MPPPVGSDDAKEQIRLRLNLVDVVRQRVPLRRQGREWVGLCPFHQEKTPSFSVNEGKQSWYCFGCGRGGDLFSFVEEYEKVDFRQALEMLAEQAGVELRERSSAERQRSEQRKRLLALLALAQRYYDYVLHETPAGAPGRKLLEERGVSTEVARTFGLGYAPGGQSLAGYLRRRRYDQRDAVEAGLVRRDGHDFFQQRVLIPIRDESGRPLAFTGRTVATDEPRKYINTAATPIYDKSRVLFGLDLARRPIEEQGLATVMEGQFDVITAHAFGVTTAVASSGTALTPEQVRILRRFTDDVVLVFDNDRAGRAATDKAVRLAVEAGMRTRVLRLDGEAKDPDEFLRQGGDWEGRLRAAREGMEQRMRDASEELDLSRPDQLQRAIRSVQQLLDEVSEPSVWERYKELAKQILGVDARQEPFRRRSPRGGSGPGRTNGHAPAPEVVASALSRSMVMLLQLLAICPEALPRVLAALPPGELSGGDHDAYLRMVRALQRGGGHGLADEVRSLTPEEQNLVRRAWADPVPGASEEVAVDAARNIRRQARAQRRRTLIAELADAERRQDSARVAAIQQRLSTTDERTGDEGGEDEEQG
ncbi:MAG: DNA primase [Candidatus Dormibacteraeota bacterium]|nr:DNA primase [Candidatus Dormibacteraeota bacterium]